MKIILCCIISIILLNSLTCTQLPLDTAGGSTSTDNAKISCSIKTILGDAAPGSFVRLRSDKFISTQTNTSSVVFNAIADGNGVVDFIDVPTGAYTLDVRGKDSHGAMVRFTLVQGVKELMLQPVTLKPIAAVMGTVSGITEDFKKKIYAVPAGIDTAITVDRKGKFSLSIPQTDSVRIFIIVEGEIAFDDRSVSVAVEDSSIVIEEPIPLVTPFARDTMAVKEIIRVNNLISTHYYDVAHIDSKLFRITALNFSERSLTVLPDGIGQLTACTTLVLNSNQLTTLPDALSQLKNLKFLNIQDNSFTQLPNCIQYLDNLQSLRCGWNPIDTVPQWINKLKNLKVFYAQSTKIALIPDFFFTIPLERISFAASAVQLLGQSIALCTTLISVSLSDNMLSVLPTGIGELSKLQELHLDKNRLTTLPHDFGKLTNLRTLELENNLLSTLPESFAKIKVSGHLRIEKNRLCEPLNEDIKLLLDKNNPGWDTTQICQ